MRRLPLTRTLLSAPPLISPYTVLRPTASISAACGTVSNRTAALVCCCCSAAAVRDASLTSRGGGAPRW